MRNHQLNNFTNITFEKLAFSDSESSEVITPTTSLDTMAFAASWDIKDGSSKNATEQNILFTTLDKYVHKTGIQQLDVLKIDVDGYEFKIIKGGYETISRLHPVIIIELSECLLHYVGDRLEDLLSILYSLGYTIQPVYSQRIPNPASLIQEVKNRKTLDCLCLYKAR
jgi:FkbM family methyltransferase